MDKQEIKSRAFAVLNSIDSLIKSGEISFNGIRSIQSFGGCMGLLAEIASMEIEDSEPCEKE